MKKIGYSFWGFLGNGIVDTPDGGRIHRLPFIKALIDEGFKITFLQKNRDLIEANEDFKSENIDFCSTGFPEIDILFLEYRWRIKGRNFQIPKANPLFTPDYFRQEELINHYHQIKPIIAWDKDLKLKNDNLFDIVFENTFVTNSARKRLLFSLDKNVLIRAKNNLISYNIDKRKNELVYIGNQYEREKSFQEYINQSAKHLSSITNVYGNWNKYPDRYEANKILYKYVSFQGRIAFSKINQVYKDSICTVLIAPERYYEKGQITQRLFEAILSYCIPLIPKEYKGVNEYIHPELVVENNKDVVGKIRKIKKGGNNLVVKLLDEQLTKMEVFLSEKQAETFANEIRKL